MKRTHKELFILFLTFYMVFSSLTGAFFAFPDQVYAAEQWEDVTQGDLVTAFRYYCKSRNLVVDGSIADALTSFTTTTFNNICNTLAINVNSLQADLKKTVEGNRGLRFLFNQQGVLAYNRIFAEFLQNNDLSVGDNVENKPVYSGFKFTDDNGNSCLVTVIKNSAPRPGGYYAEAKSNIVLGSSYLFNTEEIASRFSNTSATYTVSIYGNNYTVGYYGHPNYLGRGGTLISARNSNPPGPNVWETRSTGTNPYLFGFYTIFYFESNSKFYLGTYTDARYTHDYWISPLYEITNTDDKELPDNNVYITTNNNTINNNNYDNNYTIIYNDGDYYEDDDEPSPDAPGGGGGDDDPIDPDVPSYDPYPGGGGPSTPGTTTTGSDGIFKLPDIGFDLPDIDWSLKNIGDKFPFCIPGDIVSVLTLLNASPEAPKIQATIPIPHVYNWQIDIDFSEYDRYAFIVRTVEFLGFVISLIYLTIRMVKG